LAYFLRSLHTPTPTNAPKNPFRSVPLSEKAKTVGERIERLKEKTNLITPQLESLWSQAINTAIDVEPRWIHGDMHPQNILVKDGLLTGIIDWGDMTSGDIATDLAAFWMIFPKEENRHQALPEYGNISEATRRRAKGWAMFFGILLLNTGLLDNPRQAIIGEKILCRLS
jgi:aminoglycoside phosphotransferase (APT) family kinase protein